MAGTKTGKMPQCQWQEREWTLCREERQTGAAFLDPTLIQMMNRDAGQISKITQLCAPKAKKCHQQEEKMVMMGDPFLS